MPRCCASAALPLRHAASRAALLLDSHNSAAPPYPPTDPSLQQRDPQNPDTEIRIDRHNRTRPVLALLVTTILYLLSTVGLPRRPNVVDAVQYVRLGRYKLHTNMLHGALEVARSLFGSFAVWWLMKPIVEGRDRLSTLFVLLPCFPMQPTSNTD